MLEHSTTVRAETVEKATEKGLAELNISRSEAEIHVISEGKKGLFGFGKQDAIVEISAKNNLTLSEITDQLEEEQRTQHVVEDTPVELEETTVEVDEEVVTEEVEAPLEVETKEAAVVVEEEPEVVKTKPVVEEKRETTPSYNEEEEDDEDEEDFEEADSTDSMSIEDASQEVAKYIQSVIKSYGAHADVDFEINRSQVIFNIDTDKSGLVIGKHGKIINSLQILSQTYFQSLYRRRSSVLLNVGDYRDRRASVLRQIAKRTADEVLNTKQPVILDPLPSYERKQIHAHLARIDHIKTHSEGKEPNRYLVVEYK